jgi:hypothetical protein
MVGTCCCGRAEYSDDLLGSGACHCGLIAHETEIVLARLIICHRTNFIRLARN